MTRRCGGTSEPALASAQARVSQRARASSRASASQPPGALPRASALQRTRASSRAPALQRARASARAIWVATGALLIALCLPSTSLAQVSTSSAISRRPWVGFWLGGSGTFNTEIPRDGLDTQLSLELPIDRSGGVRIAAGRAWANEDGAPDLSIQRVVAYALIERVIHRGICVNTVYSGFGAGLYFYNFGDRPGRIRKPGYHAVLGSSCALGRVSTSVEMHGRFIGRPDLPAPRDRGVTVIDLLIGVRVRL